MNMSKKSKILLSTEAPSFLEFCVLTMVKSLPGPTFNELLGYSYGYGLKKTEVKAGLVSLIKNKMVSPWSIYNIYSTFPFTGFTITEKGESIFSLNEKESKDVYIEVSDWIALSFGKASKGRPKNKIRKIIGDIYIAKFHRKLTIKNVKETSSKIKDPIFAAKIYSKIAWHKLRRKNYYEAAPYYGSSAICYSHLNDKERAKKYYILAGKYFKKIHNIYSSLDCYYGAINYSEDVKEKQDLINQLPLPKETVTKIKPESFKSDYWKVEDEMDSFIKNLMEIKPTRAGGFLATLTNRFDEYFEEAVNENNGGKLKITSRIFYHMIEAFQVFVPKSNLQEFEDYEIIEKLDIAHRVGGFYYHVGGFFEEGYLPSERVKNILLGAYESINHAIIAPFVLIFDGMVTGGRKYDLGTKYEVLAWKISDLTRDLEKGFKIVFEDLRKEKRIDEMIKRRRCKIKGKSEQGKHIEKIMKDYPTAYKAIFRLCEEEKIFKFLLSLKERTTSESELCDFGLENEQINLLVNLGVLSKVRGRLTFNESFEDFWSSGDWLPAYLIVLLEDENKINLDFCVYIEDDKKITHEIDLIIGNKKNTIALIECKTTRSGKEIGENEIKKFFSAINTLEPIKHRYFFGYPDIGFNTRNYSISKGIIHIEVKNGEILRIKEILDEIVSEIIKEI